MRYNDDDYRQWYEDNDADLQDQKYKEWYDQQDKGEKMTLNLKLTRAPHLKERDYELIAAVDDGMPHAVKITTNKLQIERDRKDQRYISALKGVKLIYQISDGGCLLLMGKLSCSFKQPFGGEFFITKTAIEEKRNFKDVTGVPSEIFFTTYPTDITTMQAYLAEVSENPDFVFNISQFDEFMDIFGFYKTLSGELNNNVRYDIADISKPYYFVPVDEKEIETDEENAVKNTSGIVIGYKLERYKYEQLSSEQQEKVRQLVDIRIKGGDKELKKIKTFAENLFLSDEPEIKEEMYRRLVSFDLTNLCKVDGCVILMGEYSAASKFRYLHLYDMGQKIKLESIDNSLRLINQGASGSAAELLEYIIGSKQMPSENAIYVADAKKKYIERLDTSQKRAFLMATDGSPVSLIKGPPGTGKTYVINAIVQYITKELNEKVVISSQTHVAIDNVLDELMVNYDLIIPNRITNRRNKYSGKEIDVTLYKTWAKRFSEHNERSSKRFAVAIAADMARFTGEKKFKYSDEVEVGEYSVIGATTTTSAIGGKKGLELLEGYDWLIIDEVSKCPITEVLRYLPYVKKIIMVGDDFQLAPLLEFNQEEVKDLQSYDEEKFEKLKQIYEQSVFAKTLQKAEQVGRLVTLNVNYRSVGAVLNAYNIFYGNQLINMREKVKPQKVTFSDKLPNLNAKDIFFVDVKNGKEIMQDNKSRYNVEELRATAEILTDLIEYTVNPAAVTVSAIFPYAAQIEKFQRTYLDLINKAKKHFKSFEIDTVDAFQGRETDIVLVNTVVTTPQKTFLRDFRRINVAMSRARDKLFIFGNSHTLAQIDMQITGGGKRKYFGEIIEDIKRYGQIITYDGGVEYELAGKSKIKII